MVAVFLKWNLLNHCRGFQWFKERCSALYLSMQYTAPIYKLLKIAQRRIEEIILPWGRAEIAKDHLRQNTFLADLKGHAVFKQNVAVQPIAAKQDRAMRPKCTHGCTAARLNCTRLEEGSVSLLGSSAQYPTSKTPHSNCVWQSKWSALTPEVDDHTRCKKKRAYSQK